MTISARTVRRVVLSAAIVLVLAAFVVHTAPVKNIARRYLTDAIGDRLGGRAHVDELDYRLWLGEIRASGVSWSSADADVTVQAEDIVVDFAGRPTTVSLHAPEVRIAAAEGDGASSELRLPEELFTFAATISDGTLATDGLEIEGIELRVEPDGAAWSGSATTRIVRLAAGGTSFEVDSVASRFRLMATRAELLESRVENGSSFVTATGELTLLSPLSGVMNIDHSIAGALVSELVPDVHIPETVVGEATLDVAAGEWSGDGVLEVDSIVYAPLAPVRMRAPWRFDSNVLRVIDAELDGNDGRARLSATANLATNQQALDISLNEVKAVSELASRLTGDASFAVRDWDVAGGRGEADIVMRADRSLSGYPVDGRVRLDLAAGVVTVRAPRLRGDGVELGVLGRVGERIELDYTARVGDLGSLDAALANVVSGSAAAEGQVRGTLDDPRATAAISTESVSLFGVPVEASASLVVDERRVVLEPATLRHASGGALTLRGELDLEERTLSLRGDGSEFVLRDVRELEANVSALRVAIDGPWTAPTGSAEALVSNVRYRNVSFPDTALALDADGSEARIHGTSSGDPWLEATIDPREPYATEVALTLDSLPLEELLRTFPDFSETSLGLEGRVLASGELSQPESLRYRAEVDQIVGSYRDVGFGVSAPFVAEGDLDAMTLSELTLVGADTAIGISGTVPLSRSPGNGVLDVTARGVARLELLSSFMPESELSGRVSVDVRARGAPSAPTLLGDVIIDDGEARLAPIGDMRLADVSGRVGLEGTRLRLDDVTASFLGGRVRLAGDVALDAGDDSTLSFELDDVDPTALLSWADPQRAEELSATLSISGELGGGSVQRPDLFQGQGVIASAEARVRNFAIMSPSEVTWSFADGELRVAELRLTGEGSDFELSGEVMPLAEPVEWRARASGRIDPRILTPWIAELGMAITGETELDMRASGGAAPFSLEGGVSFRNGRVALRSPRLALTNVNGDLTVDDEALTLTSLEANVGGGSVRAEGNIELSGASVATVELRANAQSVRLEYPEGLRSELDGALRLHGAPEALSLTGDVTLDRAIFSRNVNLQSEILDSLERAGLVVPADTLASRTRLDIRVRTDGFRVDNNLATMDASANLTVAGTVAAPELNGTIAAREGGEFRFGRNRYRVDTARIVLDGYPDEPPELDITARTTVSQYEIRMRVSGNTDNLTTSLSGQSRRDWKETLTPADAASLLVTGRKVENVSTQGRAILGEQMASYLGTSLSDLAQFGLAGALPFDIVTEQPSLIAAETDPSARFTLGAALTESLSLVYSIGLNDAERQIWIVDYQLPRRLRSQVIRQEDNDYTFALGQQLQLDRRIRSSAAADPRATIASLGFYFVSSEPGTLDEQARSKLGLEVGEQFIYWDAWERVEQLRDWLRERGFLEAIADLRVNDCGEGCVELDVFVMTGTRVRFVLTGDDVDDDIEKALAEAWDGLMTREFLVTDLESLAEGELFRRRYYQADVTVTAEEVDNETIVSVDVVRGPRGESVVVEIVGNDAVPDGELIAVLPKRTTTEFHALITSKRPRLAQLIEVRYASRGFLGARVGEAEASFDAADKILRVTIPVVEGELSTIERVELVGADVADEAVVRSQLALVPGQAFRLNHFVQDRSAIAQSVRRQGFPDAEVDAAIVSGESPNALVARYEIASGPEVRVGAIRIAGNDTTRDGVIARELAVRSGAPLRVSDISRTQKNLYELGIFRSADVIASAASDGGDESVRDVVIEVSEVPELTFDYGARFTTGGSFQVQTDVRAPNVFGRAQGLGFRALLGTEESIFRVTYRTPYVVRYKIATDLFVERRVAELSSDGFTFRERDWSFTAQQGRPLKEFLTLQWSYSFKRTGSAFDDPILGPVELAQNQSILTASLVGDRRDSVVDPSRGSLWSVTVQGAPEFFASDFKFVKVFGQAYTFLDLGRGVVWAGGYRAGAINNLGQTLLPDDRFQAGGPSSVRGFEQSSLGPMFGGDALVVINQEIRFPIAWRLRGVGFYDAGNAFATPSDVRLSELRQNIGVGVRFVLPFGLVRFDWARVINVQSNEDPWRFVFSLGHAF